jgi:flagellin-like hook-associated protein FlgL
MDIDKKSLIYVGLGGLAIYFLFFHKNKNTIATEKEMSNFLANSRKTKAKQKLKKAKEKLKSYSQGGVTSGAIKRKLLGRVNNLSNQVRNSTKARRRRKVLRGGFFGGNVY